MKLAHFLDRVFFGEHLFEKTHGFLPFRRSLIG
jgi:hypothetical protein